MRFTAGISNLDGVEEVLGPTFYGYTDRETFSPVNATAEVLTPDDEPAYETFQAAVSEEDWNHGGTVFHPDRTIGVYVDDELVALASYEIWGDVIAHLSVITHPEYRDEGYGQAVVSRVTEHALSAGYLPQYRTSDAWPWSVALSQKLGFARFATAYLGIYEE